MSGLPGDVFAEDIFGSFFGGTWPEPPDDVALRILGFDAMPASRDHVRTAFRARLRVVHPDGTAYETVPELQRATDAEAVKRPEVAEVVWARDVLLRKIPAPVTATNVGHSEGSHPSRSDVTDASGSSEKRAQPSRPKCKACGGDGRSELWGGGLVGRNLYTDAERRQYRLRSWFRPRWEGYCHRCAEEAERGRQRDLRREQRANRACDGCGDTFTPPRADGRYCSPACRQRAYRQRSKESP